MLQMSYFDPPHSYARIIGADGYGFYISITWFKLGSYINLNAYELGCIGIMIKRILSSV